MPRSGGERVGLAVVLRGGLRARAVRGRGGADAGRVRDAHPQQQLLLALLDLMRLGSQASAVLLLAMALGDDFFSLADIFLSGMVALC